MFSLEEITTEDGLILQGVVSTPTKSSTAILWIHGLTSTFYNNVTLLNVLCEKAAGKNIAVGSFNTRGHDMITGIKKIDKDSTKGYTHILGGAGYEIFEESVYDINAMIHYFVAHDYKNIILMGHSTGANKVCYYAGNKPVSNLKATILLAPMSDRLNPADNKKEVTENISKCKELIAHGRENALVTTVSFFPMTAKRYVSLVAADTLEDQFGYGENPASLPFFENIKTPLFLGFAEKDEYADRPIEDIKKVFDIHNHSSSYRSEIVIDSSHNFAGKEELLISSMLDWIENLPTYSPI